MIRTASPTQSLDFAFLPLHMVATLLVAIGALSVVALGMYESSESHNPIAIASGLTGIGLILYVRYFLRLPWLSASVVYLMLFWLFTFGMTFTAAVVPSTLSTWEFDDLGWFDWPNVRIAMCLGVVGAAGFAFGVGVAQFGGGISRRGRVLPRPDSTLHVVGWILLIVGTAASLVTFMQNGGVGVFSMGYLTVRERLFATTGLQSTLDLAQLGCVMALCGAPEGRWKRPLAAWLVVLGMPMLLLGFRSATLIPLVTFAIVLTYRGVRLHRGVLLAGAAVALVVVPAVNAFRGVGFTNRASVNWTDVTPLETFMELGGSVRSTKAYVDWIEGGDPYLLGASYWAPIDRQVVTRLVPGREPVDYRFDPRIPLRLMDEREGAVGGSATGEAYYNFGPIGPFIYFALVGLLFGYLEWRGTTTPYRCAAMVTVMAVFFFNIRSDWLAIPAQIAQSVLFVACCYALSRVTSPRPGRVDALASS